MNLDYIATSLVIIVLPGTGVLYTLAVGLGGGFRPGVAAALGCTLGIVPAALASVAGLAAVLHASALAFTIIKYLGVLYLFYMAWNVMREGGAMDVGADTNTGSWHRTVLRGMLLNVFNPKLSLFFLAFLPQFVAPDAAAPIIAFAELAAVFMVLTFLVFVGYGACAALARDFVISRPMVMNWLRRGFGAMFGLLGLRLAFSDR